MTLMIVGLIGMIFDSNSSNTMPTMDKITIPTSSWFHLVIFENVNSLEEICYS
jgi:hypothetical protein